MRRGTAGFMRGLGWVGQAAASSQYMHTGQEARAQVHAVSAHHYVRVQLHDQAARAWGIRTCMQHALCAHSRGGSTGSLACLCRKLAGSSA